MDAFSYLAVLFSIVLGLALQQVLEGARALLLARGRVRFYAPPLIWAGSLLLIVAQSWWAMFGMRGHDDWTFAMYLAVLAQTVLLYMVASLALPHEATEAGSIDLRAVYFTNRRPFFGLFIAVAVSSIVKDVALDGHLPTPENLGFHALFVTGGLIALTTRNSLYHLANALFAAATLTIYVALLFATL